MWSSLSVLLYNSFFHYPGSLFVFFFVPVLFLYTIFLYSRVVFLCFHPCLICLLLTGLFLLVLNFCTIIVTLSVFFLLSKKQNKHCKSFRRVLFTIFYDIFNMKLSKCGMYENNYCHKVKLYIFKTRENYFFLFIESLPS